MKNLSIESKDIKKIYGMHNRYAITTKNNHYSFKIDRLRDEVIEPSFGNMNICLILSIINNKIVGFIEVEERYDSSMKVLTIKGNYKNAFKTQFAKDVGLKN